MQYSGNKNITTKFKITQGNSILSQQTVSFSSSKKSAILNVLLPAEKVGLQIFKATITSNEQEKNTYNNTKNFAVEVIDQRSNICLLYTSRCV